jgi:hypothetical protein
MQSTRKPGHQNPLHLLHPHPNSRHPIHHRLHTARPHPHFRMRKSVCFESSINHDKAQNVTQQPNKGTEKSKIT